MPEMCPSLVIAHREELRVTAERHGHGVAEDSDGMPGREILIGVVGTAGARVDETHRVLFPLRAYRQKLPRLVKLQVAHSGRQIHHLLYFV